MIKQVIVVRADLFKTVRRGKEDAQVAHASVAFITRRLQKQLEAEKGTIVYIDKVNPTNPEITMKVPASFLGAREPKKIKNLFSKEELEWMTEIPGEKSFAKIILQVDSEEELDQIYEKVHCFL